MNLNIYGRLSRLFNTERKTNMISLQNKELDMEVYQLMAKMSQICTDETLPRFKPKKLCENKWKCHLKIPGVLKEAIGYGETEVKAINSCAYHMLCILETYHKNNEYDPEAEEGFFKDNIEMWFGNLEYDHDYNYFPYFCDICLNDGDSFTRDLLTKYASNSINRLINNGNEIEGMCKIVSLRFLVRYKKKNLC